MSVNETLENFISLIRFWEVEGVNSDVIDLLKNVLGLIDDHRWVSVKERLPSKKSNEPFWILVAIPGKKESYPVKYTHDADYIEKIGEIVICPNDLKTKYTHWMPLPESPDNIDVITSNIRECPIHAWFSFSHAQYLTIPRSVLQAMPHLWKEKFAKCLSELDKTIDWRPNKGRYWCRLKDRSGRFVRDKFMEYRHPVKMPFFKEE